MGKTTGHSTDFRVVIRPRRLGDFGSMSIGDGLVTGGDPKVAERMYRDRCADIAEQARRHCDDVGAVEIECDVEHVCEHCGGDWTEQSSDYNGGCCDADEEAHTGATP